MGRPKIKLIDDSIVEEAPKKTPVSFGRKKQADSLIAQLNAELGVEEKAEVASADRDGAASRLSEEGDVRNEDSAGSDDKSESELEKQAQPIKQSKTSKPASKKAAEPETPTHSKKYLEASKDFDKFKDYTLDEAIVLVKKNSYSSFPGTLEAHINTRVTGIRGMINLPFASGKKRVILAFGKGAEASGADQVGDEKVIEELTKGKLSCDLILTTPEWMPKLAKLAKVLGPKGLMPNPKNGTITEDLKKAVESFQAGQTEYRTEAKASVIHLSLGKLNQPDEELSANIKSILQTLGKSRVKKVTLAPTMGQSVRLSLSSL